MGIFTKIASDAVAKIAGGAAKKITETQQKREKNKQISALLQYTLNNLPRYNQIIQSLQDSTSYLIEKIHCTQNRKLSFEEKRNLKKIQFETQENLKYLYLCKDYFIYLSKIASNVVLQDKEYTFIIRFSPFFDGKKVMNIDEDNDDSLLGTFKQIGQEFSDAFISSSNKFDFCDFLDNYTTELKNLILPNIQLEIEKFEDSVFSCTPTKSLPPQETLPNKEILCNHCHAKISPNTKFCPNCGAKTETQARQFCTNCGSKLSTEAKFCSNCGFKTE